MESCLKQGIFTKRNSRDFFFKAAKIKGDSCRFFCHEVSEVFLNDMLSRWRAGSKVGLGLGLIKFS